MAKWDLIGLLQQSPHWNPGGVYNPRVGDTVQFRMLPLGTPSNPKGVLLPEFRKLLYHTWRVTRPDGTNAQFRYKPISARNGRGTDHYIYVVVDQLGDWEVRSDCWKQGGPRFSVTQFSVTHTYFVKKKG